MHLLWAYAMFSRCFHICNTLLGRGVALAAGCLTVQAWRRQLPGFAYHRWGAMPHFQGSCSCFGCLGRRYRAQQMPRRGSCLTTAYQMRALFVDILINADVQDPLQLWEAHKLQKVNDFLRDAQQVTPCCCRCFCLCLSSCFDLLSWHFFFFFLLLMPFMAEAK